MRLQKIVPIFLVEVLVLGLIIVPSNAAVALAPQAPPTKSADYTFMVYMIPSSLESDSYLATADLKEMMTIGSTTNVNIIVQTGGAANATVDKERFIDFTTVQRHVVLKGSVKTVQDLGKQDMATTESLAGFIQWGLVNYPAKAYSIVLWDHGAGLLGFGYDNIYDDILTPTELHDAFAPIKNIGQKFDVIGFDACLMASIEIATNLSSAGKYLVASEELVPSWGWNYTAVLKSLAESPSQDGRSLGKVIADSYAASSKESSDKFGPSFKADESITMSVIDLAKIPDLLTSADKLGTALASSIRDPDSAYALARAIQSSERYGEGGKFSTGQLDLYGFADNIGKQFPKLAGAGNETKSLIKDAVVYQVIGDLKGNSHGIAMFMQIQKYESNAPYLRYIIGDWISLLEKERTLLQTDNVPPTIDLQMYDGRTITGYISPSDLSGVPTYILQKSPDSGASDGKRLILSIEYKEPSDMISPDGSVDYQWNEKIASLCNTSTTAGSGDCKPTLIFTENNGLAKYAYIPVRLESKNYTGMITLIYSINKTGSFEFLGGWPGIDEHGNAIRDTVPILKGDKVYTYSYEIDYHDDDYFNVIEQDPITVTSADQFGPAYHEYGGQYDLVISGCDFSGNCAYSQVFQFQVE